VTFSAAGILHFALGGHVLIGTIVHVAPRCSIVTLIVSVMFLGHATFAGGGGLHDAAGGQLISCIASHDLPRFITVHRTAAVSATGSATGLSGTFATGSRGRGGFAVMIGFGAGVVGCCVGCGGFATMTGVG
jgi:hypothetical protein